MPTVNIGVYITNKEMEAYLPNRLELHSQVRKLVKTQLKLLVAKKLLDVKDFVK